MANSSGLLLSHCLDTIHFPLAIQCAFPSSIIWFSISTHIKPLILTAESHLIFTLLVSFMQFSYSLTVHLMNIHKLLVECLYFSTPLQMPCPSDINMRRIEIRNTGSNPLDFIIGKHLMIFDRAEFLHGCSTRQALRCERFRSLERDLSGPYKDKTAPYYLLEGTARPLAWFPFSQPYSIQTRLA